MRETNTSEEAAKHAETLKIVERAEKSKKNT